MTKPYRQPPANAISVHSPSSFVSLHATLHGHDLASPACVTKIAAILIYRYIVQVPFLSVKLNLFEASKMQLSHFHNCHYPPTASTNMPPTKIIQNVCETELSK